MTRIFPIELCSYDLVEIVRKSQIKAYLDVWNKTFTVIGLNNESQEANSLGGTD